MGVGQVTASIRMNHLHFKPLLQTELIVYDSVTSSELSRTGTKLTSQAWNAQWFDKSQSLSSRMCDNLQESCSILEVHSFTSVEEFYTAICLYQLSAAYRQRDHKLLGGHNSLGESYVLLVGVN